MLNILRSALRHDADPAAAGAAGARCDEAACFGMQVHNLTIRAKGKALLESTVLTVSQGRRYGLVGPNGKGKSTLLRMVARRQVPVPDSLDVLLVEQVRRCDCAQSAAPRPACRAACWAGQPGMLQPKARGMPVLLCNCVRRECLCQRSCMLCRLKAGAWPPMEPHECLTL